jgi:hypothetical protein
MEDLRILLSWPTGTYDSFSSPNYQVLRNVDNAVVSPRAWRIAIKNA